MGGHAGNASGEVSRCALECLCQFCRDVGEHHGCRWQLFHGNLTSLFLLDADIALIRGYLREVVATIKPLHPLLIYFHQDDVDRAIRAISAERGDSWVAYQVIGS